MKNPFKRRKLETILLGCSVCGTQTPHTYKGYHGVVWSPIYVYSCTSCGSILESRKKYDIKSEMFLNEENLGK